MQLHEVDFYNQDVTSIRRVFQDVTRFKKVLYIHASASYILLYPCSNMEGAITLLPIVGTPTVVSSHVLPHA